MVSTLAIGTPGYLASGGVRVSEAERFVGTQWQLGLALVSRARRGVARFAQLKHNRPMAIDAPTTGMPWSAMERRP